MSDEEGTALVHRPDAPLPVYSGEQMGRALVAYKGIQRSLDKEMPDQIMEIGKQKFRKKGYWRAVRVAFALDMEMVAEELIRVPAPPGIGKYMPDGDWGYTATYRATSPDGRSMVGDGSAMASEKLVFVKDWDAWRNGGKRGKPKPQLDADGDPKVDQAETAKNATIHNVRAHAHTRAKNRAIADLVGFGEVSAEELPPDRGGREQDREQDQYESENPAPGPQPGPVDGNKAKAADLWAHCWNMIDSGQMTADQRVALFARAGVEKGRPITVAGLTVVEDEIKRIEAKPEKPAPAADAKQDPPSSGLNLSELIAEMARVGVPAATQTAWRLEIGIVQSDKRTHTAKRLDELDVRTSEYAQGGRE